MSRPEDLINSCQERLGSEGVADAVVAAGVFALQDNYKAITAGGAATALLPGGDNPLLAGIEGAGAIEASRQANAIAHGVSERMLVCVTATNIYVFALRPPAGHDPKELLASFDRAGATVEVKHFGLSRRLLITEGEQKLALTGSTARFSSESAGDKSVLAELG